VNNIKTLFENNRHGLIDDWLRPIKDLYQSHLQELNAVKNVDATVNRLCELNVEAQVFNVASTAIVQEAWMRSQPVTVHGWIYNIADGLLQNLGLSLANKTNSSAPTSPLMV
jgi:carbonic anhydrase